MAKNRVFIVMPAQHFPHDKVHYVCVTKAVGDISDIFANDNYVIKKSVDSMGEAKKVAEKLGSKRPKVI